MKKALAYLVIPVVAILIMACTTSNNKQEGTQEKMEIKNENTAPVQSNPHYIISISAGKTKLGDIEIELFPEIAPKHVHNFDSLVAAKFYDGTAFHRVIPGFMIQGGDPNTKDDSKKALWGTGQPGQTRVPAEFNSTKHVRGIISAARTNDPNSATSQFFIMHGDAPHLDGQYSVYGKVVTGLEVVDKVCAQPREGSTPIEKISMTVVKK
jgi:peptidyl-prolyl cis-trans isomerase B (cyclophilin B)